MKNIWSPAKIYDYLNNSNIRPINPDAYCTKSIPWRDLLKYQTEMPTITVLINLSCVANLLQKYLTTYFNDSEALITSGWRSQAYNKKIGGSNSSYHLSGMALDFLVKNYSPKQVQLILNPVHNGGLEFAPTWTHIDIRNYRARFKP